ncbi:Uncharacterised protein [Mycobacterium tuberculosis]|nr:Uncharacterised protein [Mycobacterium tuberculosis]
MLQADAGQITGHELGRAALLSVRTHRGHHRDRGAGHDGRPGIEHAATFDQVDTRGRSSSARTSMYLGWSSAPASTFLAGGIC